MIKVFLTNLGKYNEGNLIGKWLVLPASKDEIDIILKSIGINEEYGEFFITDWEYENKITEGIIQINEYSNLYELNELFSKLSKCNNLEIVSSLVRMLGLDIDEAIENIENYNYIVLNDYNLNNELNLAYTYIEDVYGDLESLKKTSLNLFKTYFNEESFMEKFKEDYFSDDIFEFTEKEIRNTCENYIKDLGIENISIEYFDMKSFGRDLAYDFLIDDITNIAIANY